MAASAAIFNPGHDYSSSTRRPSAAAHHTIEYRPLAGGSLGTFQSLDAMRAAVLGHMPPDFSGYRDGYNKSAADAICAHGPDTRPAQMAALFDFVARSLVYTPHPFNQQTIQDCRRTLEIGEGDCVSKSVCLATLLACLGIRPRFVAQCDGAEFTHVYVEALGHGGWLALDPVAADQPAGWTQPLNDGGFETTWEIFHG